MNKWVCHPRLISFSTQQELCRDEDTNCFHQLTLNMWACSWHAKVNGGYDVRFKIKRLNVVVGCIRRLIMASNTPRVDILSFSNLN